LSWTGRDSVAVGSSLQAILMGVSKRKTSFSAD
jgi:hypothetical protein